MEKENKIENFIKTIESSREIIELEKPLSEYLKEADQNQQLVIMNYVFTNLDKFWLPSIDISKIFGVNKKSDINDAKSSIREYNNLLTLKNSIPTEKKKHLNVNNMPNVLMHMGYMKKLAGSGPASENNAIYIASKEKLESETEEEHQKNKIEQYKVSCLLVNSMREILCKKTCEVAAQALNKSGKNVVDEKTELIFLHNIMVGKENCAKNKLDIIDKSLKYQSPIYGYEATRYNPYQPRRNR